MESKEEVERGENWRHMDAAVERSRARSRLLDQFAGQAMSGMLADPNVKGGKGIVLTAYEIAEYMVEEHYRRFGLIEEGSDDIQELYQKAIETTVIQARKIAELEAAIRDTLAYLKDEEDAPDLGELFTQLEALVGKEK